MNNRYLNKPDLLSSSNSKYYLYLFLLWPFLAFITALSNFSRKESRLVIYNFFIYYGLTFVLSSYGYVDAAGYAMQFRINATLPFSDFFKIVGGLYSADTSVDIVEPFISFVVSRFTDDYRILFAVFAAIFGFVYMTSISLVYKKYILNQNLNAVFHFIFFSIIIPITWINGFRMWTAAWIFFYGAHQVIISRDPRYILLSLSACLVHFSFLTANVILIIYFLAGNRNYIYLPLALVSFVLPNFIAPLFQSLSLKLGGAMQSRFETYASSDYLTLRQETVAQSAWFLRIGNSLVFYYLLLAIIIIKIRSKDLITNSAENNLYSFLLLFLTFVNFSKNIPSFGGRFQIIFCLFATLYLLMYFGKISEAKIDSLTWIGLFPILLFTAVAFRQGSESINAWILTPGLGLPLFVPGFSIADLLFY